ncbi:hypothetical protein [Streptomyces tritici]|uniref:hypothetical protein n=1 Tax=Streptomyces tritici TaxID=2054410 RepID=UPI003AEF482C
MAEISEQGVSFELRQVMGEIVAAVRHGDDARLEILLERFAGMADDVQAVFLLRSLLREGQTD